jgi:hypothetical protein
MDEDSGNGSVGSESAHAFSGPQQTDSPMSRNGSRTALGGANERHLATLNSHQLYDFAYEARQKQMEAEISGGRFGYGRIIRFWLHCAGVFQQFQMWRAGILVHCVKSKCNSPSRGAGRQRRETFNMSARLWGSK